jgi:uncharacterized protein YkwD
MVVRSLFRRSTVIAIAIGCLASPAVITHADAGSKYRFKFGEKCFMRKINKARRYHGLRPLTRDKQLGYVARLHARKMASDSSVWDDLSIGHRVTRWTALANNTGRGGGCRQLNWAFRQSAFHHANMLGPYRYVGVGVAWHHGNMYVSENFEAHSNPGNIYRWP